MHLFMISVRILPEKRYQLMKLIGLESGPCSRRASEQQPLGNNHTALATPTRVMHP